MDFTFDIAQGPTVFPRVEKVVFIDRVPGSSRFHHNIFQLWDARFPSLRHLSVVLVRAVNNPKGERRIIEEEVVTVWARTDVTAEWAIGVELQDSYRDPPRPSCSLRLEARTWMTHI